MTPDERETIAGPRNAELMCNFIPRFPLFTFERAVPTYGSEREFAVGETWHVICGIPPELVLRRQQFLDDHPGVSIGPDQFGTFSASVPAGMLDDTGMVTHMHEHDLAVLLDRLDAMLAPAAVPDG